MALNIFLRAYRLVKLILAKRRRFGLQLVAVIILQLSLIHICDIIDHHPRFANRAPVWYNRTEKFSMEGGDELISVSYTHLDVYKRQL